MDHQTTYQAGNWNVNETISTNPEADSLEPLFNFIVLGVLMNIVGVLGIVANIISMIIFMQPQMKTSSGVLLFGLAFCDSVLDVGAITYVGLPTVYLYTGYTFRFFHFILPPLEPYIHIMTQTAYTSTLYLTVAVTVERFIAVYHPLKVKLVCTRRRSIVIAILVPICSFLFILPKFWEVHLSQITVTENNVTSVVYRTDISVYSEIYGCLDTIVAVVPLISCLILNILIFKKFRKIKVERMNLTFAQTDEVQKTKIIVFIVQAFLLCNILEILYNLCSFENSWVLPTLNWFCIVLNNLVNFIICVTFWKMFRTTFLGLFGVKSDNNRPPAAKCATPSLKSSTSSSKIQSSVV